MFNWWLEWKRKFSASESWSNMWCHKGHSSFSQARNNIPRLQILAVRSDFLLFPVYQACRRFSKASGLSRNLKAKYFPANPKEGFCAKGVKSLYLSLGWKATGLQRFQRLDFEATADRQVRDFLCLCKSSCKSFSVLEHTVLPALVNNINSLSLFCPACSCTSSLQHADGCLQYFNI